MTSLRRYPVTRPSYVSAGLPLPLRTVMTEPKSPDPRDTDRFRRARDIFESAADRPRVERAGFIERVCDGDAALAAEVDRMLRAAAAPHRWLDSSVWLVPRLHSLDQNYGVSRFGARSSGQRSQPVEPA